MNLALILVNIVLFMYKSDPIVVFSNSYVSSRLVKNVYIILPVALSTLSNPFGKVLFNCFLLLILYYLDPAMMDNKLFKYMNFVCYCGSNLAKGG